jgi:GT2 family glycosyltransferase
MPEEFAPPVVAIVASADPGSWFEECLSSLGAQDYPNLDVLVVDDASSTVLTTRVAAVLPRAFVRRRPERGGLSTSFDEALSGVDGASFFLFCHDDVALEPETVRVLVSESFRSNAAVVGPKVVDWQDPTRLVQVGLNVTRRGEALPRVEDGELDQSQHDEVREVFATPGGCMLVRTDLFAALGGFDRDLDGFGEDVDLCWRAQVAGARVAVAPTARVRHLQATVHGERGRVDAAALRRRNELRSVLKNRGAVHLLGAAAGEIAGSAARGLVNIAAHRRRPRRGALDAWRWNLAHRESLRESRRLLHELRQVSDRELATRMTKGGRTRHVLRRIPSHDETPSSPDRTLRAHPRANPHSELDRLTHFLVRLRAGEVSAGPALGGVAVAVLLLLGLRGVLFGHLPVVGSLVPLPRASTMLGQYFTGRPEPGWAAVPGVAPPAYAIVGLLGVVLGNSSALVLKLLLVSGVTIGAIGASRLVRPFATPRARVVTAAAYAASPLQWNAISHGDIAAAVALAGAPYLLGRLARATGFAGEVPVGWETAGLVSEASRFAFALAVVVSFAPAMLLVVGVAWVALSLATLVTARAAGAALSSVARSAVVTVAAAAGALLLSMPWSGSWLAHGADWSLLTGARGSSQALIGPAAYLTGHFGPFGGWWAAFGLLVTGAAVLFVGSGRLLEWATRWWAVALGGAVFAWAGARGLLGTGFGDSAVLVSVLAAGTAAAVGLAVSGFETELRLHGLGWRQAVSALATVALVVGLLPGLSALLGGRGDLPATGFDQYLGWTASTSGAPHGARTLWVGEPSALPGSALQLSPGLALFATPDGLPSGDQFVAGIPSSSLLAVRRDVNEAEAGTTARLGALLAPEGVRYIVVPTAEAPVVPGGSLRATSLPPAVLVSSLQAQSDLRQRLTEAGVLVFQNTSWRPSDGAGTAATGPAGRAGGDAAWRDAGLGIALASLVLGLAELVSWRRRGGAAHRLRHDVAETAAAA